jgi:hypothetical protein
MRSISEPVYDESECSPLNLGFSRSAYTLPLVARKDDVKMLIRLYLNETRRVWGNGCETIFRKSQSLMN